MTVHELPKAKAPSDGYRMFARGSDRAEVFLYDIIGGYYGGVSAQQFVADLRKMGAVRTIDLRINSEGGSVTEAEAIHTHLVEHKARVIAHIDGMAASAASFIAMAADEIVIADSGFIMIHEARTDMRGTAAKLREQADLMDRVNTKIVAKYVARTKQAEADIRKWMAAETWFLGQEAVDAGFADRVVENLKVAASVRDPSKFTNLPAALRPNRARAAAALAAIRG